MATALVLVTVAYVYYVPSGQRRQAVGLYFRNRFINQVFKRAPEFNATELNSDTYILLYWTPFFQNAAFDGFGRAPFAKCPVRVLNSYKLQLIVLSCHCYLFIFFQTHFGLRSYTLINCIGLFSDVS